MAPLCKAKNKCKQLFIARIYRVSKKKNGSRHPKNNNEVKRLRLPKTTFGKDSGWLCGNDSVTVFAARTAWWVKAIPGDDSAAITMKGFMQGPGSKIFFVIPRGFQPGISLRV